MPYDYNSYDFSRDITRVDEPLDDEMLADEDVFRLGQRAVNLAVHTYRFVLTLPEDSREPLLTHVLEVIYHYGDWTRIELEEEHVEWMLRKNGEKDTNGEWV